jgi:hypothetical protein
MLQKLKNKIGLSEQTDDKTSDEVGLLDGSVDKKTITQQLETDYDGTVEMIIDKAIGVSCQNSFLNFGFYQLISFMFIATVNTIVNGWYGYSIVFAGNLT